MDLPKRHIQYNHLMLKMVRTSPSSVEKAILLFLLIVVVNGGLTNPHIKDKD